MFGFVARKDPAQGAHGVNVARVTDAIRGFGLVVVVITVWLASPRPGSDGPRGLAVAVTLALSAAAWVAWLLSGATGDRGTLTREGLAAARRAILALREDAAPLLDQLSSLAAQYQAAGDAPINLAVTGAPRPLSEQASQVAYRTAQEGLTNARKHAPGQPVTLALGFEPGQVTVTIENPLPPPDSQGPLAETGAGAGLTGLRERAALAGGTLEAGPVEGIWRVDLTIPA